MTETSRFGARGSACPHEDAELRRMHAAEGGHKCFTLWCPDCRSHVAKQLGFPGIWIGKSDPKVAHIDPESVPWMVRETVWRVCQGPCRQLAECQFHHLAPKAFFGDEADEWPTAWLCVSCHARWHSLVTPGLCTAYDAAFHARQLIDYLGLDRAAALTRALIDQGKARRAGAA